MLSPPKSYLGQKGIPSTHLVPLLQLPQRKSHSQKFITAQALTSHFTNSGHRSAELSKGKNTLRSGHIRPNQNPALPHVSCSPQSSACHPENVPCFLWFIPASQGASASYLTFWADLGHLEKNAVACPLLLQIVHAVAAFTKV